MLAPMVGITHYAVRAAAATFLNPGTHALWTTEMLNSRRIPSQHVNESPETTFKDHENGLCPQLLANEEEFIRLSIPKLELWGAAAIDINMGCPMTKALKHNYGVALMGDPVYAAEVVKMAVKNSTVPVSVKLRAGLEGQSFDYLVSFIDGLFQSGASWVTIHPRTGEQKRRGSADWGLLLRLKKQFAFEGKKRTIIGNGDVQCYEDIQNLFEASQCERVMIGRAMVVKPWLIRGEPEPDVYTQGEWYGDFLKKVLQECTLHYEEKAGLRRMRFLVVQGKPWVEYGEFLNGRVAAATNYPEMKIALEQFFSQKQKIIKRTALKA